MQVRESQANSQEHNQQRRTFPNPTTTCAACPPFILLFMLCMVKKYSCTEYELQLEGDRLRYY